jgi:hypothetical protein
MQPDHVPAAIPSVKSEQISSKTRFGAIQPGLFFGKTL